MKKLLLIRVSVIASLGVVAIVLPVLAQSLDVTLQIPILGEQKIRVCDPGPDKTLICTGIAKYIAYVYRWLVGFAALLAVLAFTWGGIQWLVSGGESGKIQEARKVIGNALIGLVLALGSYLFLAAINVNLVQYKPLSITSISPLELKIADLIATHAAVRGRFTTSPGVSVTGFSHVTFDADSKKDIETPGFLTQVLVDALKEIDAQGFTVKVSTLKSGHNVGSFHNAPGDPKDGRAADIVGTTEELSRLAAFLKTNQSRLQVNELYYAFNPDNAVEECVPQNSSYLNAPKRAKLKKDHEDHLHFAVGCGVISFPKTTAIPAPFWL